MLKIINPLVRTLSVSAKEISWEIENTTEDPWDYTFQIYRSEGQQGPWDPITDTFTDRYYYIDNNISRYRHSRYLFYKIKIVRNSDSNEDYSDIFTSEGPGNLYSNAISRVERLVFRKFAGQRVFVLPIKTFGFRCGCWDQKLGKRTKGDCIQCYNTGFVGGYMNAIETYVQISADPYKNVPAQGYETEPRANNIVATNYPIIKPYDLIIQPDLNYRWKVAAVSNTRLGGSLVHQNLTVSGVEEDDIAFDISLDTSALSNFRPETMSNMRTTI